MCCCWPSRSAQINLRASCLPIYNDGIQVCKWGIVELAIELVTCGFISSNDQGFINPPLQHSKAFWSTYADSFETIILVCAAMSAQSLKQSSLWRLGPNFLLQMIAWQKIRPWEFALNMKIQCIYSYVHGKGLLVPLQVGLKLQMTFLDIKPAIY